MDFSLTEEQKTLQITARSFLSKECPTPVAKRILTEDPLGYSPELWAKMAGLGWLGLPFPPQYGGGGGSFLSLAVLMEEMGRARFPSPYLQTVISSGLAILSLGTSRQKADLLPRIARGDLIAAWAPGEAFDWHDKERIAATTTGGGYVVDGVRRFVSFAHIAHLFLVCGKVDQKADSVGCFLIDAQHPGAKISLLDVAVHNALREGEVRLTQARLDRAGLLGGQLHSEQAIGQVASFSTIARCAEMVGAAQSMFDRAVDYAKHRVQYGHPIGSYQVIQHYCANMNILVDGMRVITYEAAWKLDQGMPCDPEVAMAKAWVSDGCRDIAALAYQIHGAIGYNWDHDMPLFFFFEEAARDSFGDSNFHRERLIRLLDLGQKDRAR